MFSISRNDVQEFILALVGRGLAANPINGVYQPGGVDDASCRGGWSHRSALSGAYHAAAYLGLRWQEIAGLRLRYLELERGRPATLRVISTIERSGGRCHVVDLGKTKAAWRTLVMPEFLRAALVDHVANYSDEQWVFAAPKRGFLRYDNFRTREWSPAVERAGLAPLTFHCLRHTAAGS